MPIIIRRRAPRSADPDAAFQGLMHELRSLQSPAPHDELSLAICLSKVRDQFAQRLKGAAAEIGLSLRKTYYLLAIADAVGPLLRKHPKLRDVGWTKLAVLAPHLTAGNAADLIERAQGMSTRRLTLSLQNEASASSTRCILLYMNPDQYALYEAALLKVGAKRSRNGRGIRHQEEALLQLIALANAGPA